MKRKKLTEEEVYNNKKEYIKRYIKEKTFVLQIGLNKDKDADIIGFLETIPNGNKRDYIRQLIRQDIERRNYN